MPPNFLDRPGIDRSDPKCKNLCDLLVHAYEIGESKHLLMSIGLDDGDLPENYKNKREFWWLALEIIADREGKLRQLVQTAAVDPTKSSFGEKFEAFLIPSEPAAIEGTQASLLPMRELRDIPFDSLPEDVQQLIARFEARRRAYEQRRDEQSGRS